WVPAAAAGAAGDPRPASLPRAQPGRGCRDARHPGRHSPIATPLRPSSDAHRPRGGRTHLGARGKGHLMNSRNEIERALDGFFAEGPETVADQAFLRALDAVDRTTQRRGVLEIGRA